MSRTFSNDIYNTANKTITELQDELDEKIDIVKEQGESPELRQEIRRLKQKLRRRRQRKQNHDQGFNTQQEKVVTEHKRVEKTKTKVPQIPQRSAASEENAAKMQAKRQQKRKRSHSSLVVEKGKEKDVIQEQDENEQQSLIDDIDDEQPFQVIKKPRGIPRYSVHPSAIVINEEVNCHLHCWKPTACDKVVRSMYCVTVYIGVKQSFRFCNISHFTSSNARALIQSKLESYLTTSLPYLPTKKTVECYNCETTCAQQIWIQLCDVKIHRDRRLFFCSLEELFGFLVLTTSTVWKSLVNPDLKQRKEKEAALTMLTTNNLPDQRKKNKNRNLSVT